ncbi:Uncharacterised protein [Yersinia intermedia]|nr:Uncharacterised protein [Yersinia intermedia]CQD77455.1 Uncharacterised protein [Yersinia intermedia]
MSLADEIVQLLNDTHVDIWNKYKRTKKLLLQWGWTSKMLHLGMVLESQH